MDEQVGYEKAMTLRFSALAGANLIFGMGGVEAGMTLDLAQLVIDDEIVAMVRRAARGISLTDETLALAVIKKVGPGGDYLGQKYTRLHQHEELAKVRLTDRRMRGAWERRGARTMVQNATQRAREILETHTPTPLPEEVSKKIQGIIAEARAELAERSL